MICQSCKDKRHEDCRGGSWCDCQHQSTEEKPKDSELGWRRQG